MHWRIKIAETAARGSAITAVPGRTTTRPRVSTRPGAKPPRPNTPETRPLGFACHRRPADSCRGWLPGFDALLDVTGAAVLAYLTFPPEPTYCALIHSSHVSGFTARTIGRAYS